MQREQKMCEQGRLQGDVRVEWQIEQQCASRSDARDSLKECDKELSDGSIWKVQLVQKAHREDESEIILDTRTSVSLRRRVSNAMT